MNHPSIREDQYPEEGAKRLLGPNEVRVKVGNFVLSNELILNSGDYFHKDESGNHSPILKAGPIWWSAHFYSTERVQKLGWFDFKKAENTPQDVKFSIRRSVIRELVRIFSVTKSRTFESEIYRELQEELAFESFPGRHEVPALTQSDVSKIQTRYGWVVIYERPREEDEGFDLSISRFFEVEIPRKIRRKLQSVGGIIFSPNEKEWRLGEIRRDGEIIQISRKAKIFRAYQKWRVRNFSRIAQEDWKYSKI